MVERKTAKCVRREKLCEVFSFSPTKKQINKKRQNTSWSKGKTLTMKTTSEQLLRAFSKDFIYLKFLRHKTIAKENSHATSIQNNNWRLGTSYLAKLWSWATGTLYLSFLSSSQETQKNLEIQDYYCLQLLQVFLPSAHSISAPFACRSNWVLV